MKSRTQHASAGGCSLFELDARLAADTYFVGKTPLCRLLLMDDARFPWLILVPEVAAVSEPFDLSEANQAALWRESMHLSRFLKAHYQADKLNIAALGNQVPQLHLHHIARYHSDVAWPGPVWGVGTPEAYAAEAVTHLIRTLREGLAIPLALTLTE